MFSTLSSFDRFCLSTFTLNPFYSHPSSSLFCLPTLSFALLQTLNHPLMELLSSMGSGSTAGSSWVNPWLRCCLLLWVCIAFVTIALPSTFCVALLVTYFLLPFSLSDWTNFPFPFRFRSSILSTWVYNISSDIWSTSTTKGRLLPLLVFSIWEMFLPHLPPLQNSYQMIWEYDQIWVVP